MNFYENINAHKKDHRCGCKLRRIGLCGLVLLLSLCMAASAYAAGGSDSITDGSLVSVDISWGEMQFTYTDEHQLWNPSTHAYDRDVAAVWTSEENWITLANPGSNAVKAEFDVNMSVSSVSGVFTSTEDGEAFAGTIELDTNESNTVWFELSGEITTTYDKLGEIVITIVAK